MSLASESEIQPSTYRSSIISILNASKHKISSDSRLHQKLNSKPKSLVERTENSRSLSTHHPERLGGETFFLEDLGLLEAFQSQTSLAGLEGLKEVRRIIS